MATLNIPTKKIDQIAVIGEHQFAASLALSLSNTGEEIMYFDCRNSAESILTKTLEIESGLLFSPEFLKYIKPCDWNGLLQLNSGTVWAILAIDNLRQEKIKDLLNELETFPQEQLLISFASKNKSLKPYLGLVPSSLEPRFAAIRFYEPFRTCGLAEMIALPGTNNESIEAIRDFCENKIGKTVILPYHPDIVDRIICFVQVWSMRTGLNLAIDLEQINQLTGHIIGSQEKGIIRLIDREGPKNLYARSKNLFQKSEIPEEKEAWVFLNLLVQPPMNYYSGNKIFDPLKGKYRTLRKKKIKIISELKELELKERLPMMLNGSSIYHRFYQEFWQGIFKYLSHLVENKETGISQADEIFREALGWELGPFEIWHNMDTRNMVKLMEMDGFRPDPWVYKLLDSHNSDFIMNKDGRKLFYDISGNHLPADNGRIFLTRSSFNDKKLWQNERTDIFEIDDCALNVEIHNYRNIIDEEMATGILKALDLAESGKKGLIISARGKNFTVGANLGLVFIAAIEKNYKLIGNFLKEFQRLTSRIRYAEIPVLMMPKGITLGGGCEMALHCDDLSCLAETYIGLPEARVGLVPAGGGLKAMAFKLFKANASPEQYLMTLKAISEGAISTSAFDAIRLKYVDREDQVIRNKSTHLTAAKEAIAKLMENGYKKPMAGKIRPAGKTVFRYLETAIDNDEKMSPFARKISRWIAHILTGGNLPEAEEVSESHYLELEQEAFLSLAGEKETLKTLRKFL